MRIVSDKSKFVVITGMPRSGTTLVTSLLHSAEGGYFVSEPMNGFLEVGYATYPDGTTGHPDEVVSFLQGLLLGTCKIVGVKEVFEGIPPATDSESPILLDYVLPKADLIILCRRDPVAVFASQKAVLGVGLQRFYWRCERYRQWVKNLKTAHVTIDYEALCSDPLKHLNERLTGHFSIDGPLVKRGMGGNGDTEARFSEKINPPAVRPGLTAEEIRTVRMFTCDWDQVQ